MRHPFQRAPAWVALAVLIMFGVAGVGYFASRQADDVDSWMVHTRGVLDALSGVGAAASAMEQGAHDYVLTGDERFLEPYHTGMEQGHAQIAQIDSLVKDNAAQAAHAATLRLRFREDADTLSRQIALRRDNAFERARELIIGQPGINGPGDVHQTLAQMKSTEEALLAARIESAGQTRRFALSLGALGVLFDVIITAMVFEMLRRENKQRRDMQQALTESNQKLSASLQEAALTTNRLTKTVESMPMGVLITDAELRVITFNDRLLDMLGAPDGAIRPGDGLEKVWLFGMDKDAISEEHIQRLAERRRDLIENPKPYRFERIHQNGRMLEARGAPIPGGGFIKVYTDITKQHAESEKLLAERNSAEEIARAKSEFLAVMSHEVRTPMNGVMGVAEMLRDTGLTTEQKNYVDIILRSGESLLTILNDILDLSKVEANKVELEEAPFDAERLLRDMVALWEPRATDKGLSLNLRLASELPHHLIGDAGRLRQVFNNLIGNSVKFTERGGVTIDARMMSQDLDSATLSFSITDTGIGMNEEQRARLFQPFSQADASTTRRFGGTGLGLAISLRLVEMMGGAFDVYSQEGHGSVFTFTGRFKFGRMMKDQEQAPATPAPFGDRTYEGCVLVVEDHPVNRSVARASLTRLGLTVKEAVNGREAVDIVAREKVDLVFMDMHMPVMDGMTATREIRAAEEQAGGRRLPIVAMTANVLPEAVGACIDAGMDGFLCKPFSRAQLAETLEHWLAGAAPDVTAPAVFAPVQDEAPASEAPTPAGEPVPAPPFAADAFAIDPPEAAAPAAAPGEPVVLFSRVAPVEEVPQEDVIDADRYALLEETMGSELDELLYSFHATTGELIPSLKQACEKWQCTQAFRDAHTLASSAAMVGAKRLSTLARELENKAKDGGGSEMIAMAARIEEEYERYKQALAAMMAEPG